MTRDFWRICEWTSCQEFVCAKKARNELSYKSKLQSSTDELEG